MKRNPLSPPSLSSCPQSYSLQCVPYLLSPGLDTEPVDGVKDPDQLVGCVVGGGDGRVRADSDGAVKDR